MEHPAAVYYAAGTYNTSLSVSNSLGSSAQLKTGYITVAPGPQQPSINVAGNLFSASPSNGFSYQWYQNGNVIIGATGFSHTASSPGIYTVKLGSSNNCSRISLPFYYQVTDVTDPSASGQLSVFPNPTTGGVTLSGYAGPDGDYELRCYNSAGLLVLVSNIPVHDRLDYPVDFAGKAPGVYQLMLTSKDGRFRHQLSVLVR
ncbi:MAG: hypothetical protein EOP49_04240 [Sphingobacteriales bacterium]|nr:MAG: hypothetical protein EOP49_04240 [Sphingobacteriales bacterium]